MSKIFRFQFPIWLSTDGDEPAPPKTPKRPGRAGEQGRAASSGQWLLIIAMAIAATLVVSLMFSSSGGAHVDYSVFRGQLEAEPSGNVALVQFRDDKIIGEWKNPPDDPNPKSSEKAGEEKQAPKKLPKKFTTVRPPVEDKELIPLLQKYHVPFSSEPSNWGPGANLFISGLSMLLVIGFVWFMLRRSVDPLGPGGMAGSFIRSPAKRFTPSEQNHTFDDVAGMEQAKRELQEVVEFLKTPAKFQRLGAQIPKGVLLMGPPGTGKTLLARATAGEAGVPLFSVNGVGVHSLFFGRGARP